MIECKYLLDSFAVVVKIVICLRLFWSVIKLHSVPSKVYDHANNQHATVCRSCVGLPWAVVRSPHEEQFRQDNQEGVPNPGRHLVSGRGPDRVISHQTFKLLSNFLLASIFINIPCESS